MANVKSATVTLNLSHQNIEALHHLIGNILGRADCDKYGRLGSACRVDFLWETPVRTWASTA